MEQKKRGRPPKDKTNDTALSKRSHAGTIEARSDPGTAERPSERINRGPGEIDFRLMLSKTVDSVSMTLVNRRGIRVSPDFRRFGGLHREVLREFQAGALRDGLMLRWDDPDKNQDGNIVRNPDSRLIDLAAKAGILTTAELETVTMPEGECQFVLLVNRQKNGLYSVSPAIYDGSGTDFAGKDNPRAVHTISPRHVLMGCTLYRVLDLGSLWFEDSRLMAANIGEADIQVFLSLALSRFPWIEVRFEGYSTVESKPRVARPALVFSEIDAYGYLHVRPVSALPGFAPGFFEDHEITRVAELDDDERQLRISEVLFPEFADEAFRSALAAMGKDAKHSVFEESGYFILTADFSRKFLSERMPFLMSDFGFFQAEKLSSYRMKPVRPRLKLALSTGIDYLEGSASVEIDGESFSYARFLADYRRQKFIALGDGTKAYPEAKEVSRLERLLRLSKDGENVTVSFFDIPALTRNADLNASGSAWKRPEAFYKGYNSISGKKERFVLEGTELRPYQEYGAKWMDYLRTHGLSGCLADEMGLGKTIQAIALLRRVHAEPGEARPSLIVMPRSLIYNWKSELERFAPELTVSVHYGSDRDTETAKGAHVILTSYAVARVDIEALSGIQFRYVILDEAQMIKNSEAKTTHAILRLRAAHRLALSGTPVENSLGDLYSLFGFLNPGMFGTQKEFLASYLVPIQENQDEEALRDLKARIYPFLLRRMKRDVLPELPAKTEQVAYIELDPGHLALYHRRREELKHEIEGALGSGGFAKNRFAILQAFTELRRLASVPEAEGTSVALSAKREYLREAAGEIASNGHKCLVFTNYLASVDFISDDFALAGIGNLIMTGATTDRQSLVRSFQADPGVKAFIMTLKTGGLGLNLTAADYVFIFDPWWNRAAEAQAIDRTHRIGQKNPVFCYRLIAKDTIEEKILELQERKSKLASSLLTSDADAFKLLDEADIRYLLE